MMSDLFADLAREFRRDERAVTSLLFALTLIPMMIAIGVAVDYSRILRYKTAFDRAADAAALGAVAMTYNGQISTPNKTAVANQFAAELGEIADTVPYSVDVSSVGKPDNITVTVNFSATLPMTLTQIIGVDTVDISGSAQATVDLPKFYDFYLLLDNSPSMGIPATTEDIEKMQNLTGGCAFACHRRTFDSAKRIIGDDPYDYYHLAKNNNITTRVDVLRMSTQQLIATATRARLFSNQFRMAIYTFSDIVTPIVSLTGNLTSVQSAAGAIDLAYDYSNDRGAQTDYGTALSYISSIIPPGGNGSSQGNAQKYLFFVTDGVEDKPVQSGSGAGNQPDLWPNGASGWPAGSILNMANTDIANAGPTRRISSLDPALCSHLKSNGVNIAVLYTTYLQVPPYVSASSVSSGLSQCASPGLFFEVSPSQGIEAAMQQMFNAALLNSRLTR